MPNVTSSKITEAVAILRNLIEQDTGAKVLIIATAYNKSTRLTRSHYAISECDGDELSSLYFELNNSFFKASEQNTKKQKSGQ